jgi:lincosamide nucleotidyltransferase A/C/D/E
MVARQNDRGDHSQGWAAPAGSPGDVTGRAHAPRPSMMTSHDVIRVVDGLHLSGIQVVVAGGWGIDALVGQQTRAHRNLDIVVEHDQSKAALEALLTLGYDHITSSAPQRFTARTVDGRTVDIETVPSNPRRPSEPARGYYHPADGFDGRGFIVGRPVRCLSAIAQVLRRPSPPPGSPIDVLERHRHDLRLLGDRCNVAVPVPFGNGPHTTYRAAKRDDVGAMAIVRAAALAEVFKTDSVLNCGVNQAYRYWQRHATGTGKWVGVMTVGGAIGATIGVAPGPHVHRSEPAHALLFALHLSPVVTDWHLLDPLLQRALLAAAELGCTDVRVWLPVDDARDRRFFEQRGWRPDGGRATLPNGLHTVRYRNP